MGLQDKAVPRRILAGRLMMSLWTVVTGRDLTVSSSLVIDRKAKPGSDAQLSPPEQQLATPLFLSLPPPPPPPPLPPLLLLPFCPSTLFKQLCLLSPPPCLVSTLPLDPSDVQQPRLDAQCRIRSASSHRRRPALTRPLQCTAVP